MVNSFDNLTDLNLHILLVGKKFHSLAKGLFTNALGLKNCRYTQLLVTKAARSGTVVDLNRYVHVHHLKSMKFPAVHTVSISSDIVEKV